MSVSGTYKANQNTVFLLAFSLMAVFSAMRLFSSLQMSGSRRVITYFNTFIFFSALLRVLFCALPLVYHTIVESPHGSADIYVNTIYGLSTGQDHKTLILVSEIVLSLGNWSLYGVFIIIACYWAYMLKKLHGDIESSSGVHLGASSPASSPGPLVVGPTSYLYASSMLNTNGIISDWTRRCDSIELFKHIMIILLLLQTIIYLLYLYYGLLIDLLLHDAILLSLVAVIVLISITYLSKMINEVLHTMEAFNRSAAQAQLHRIYMIIMVANLFFYTRLVLEGTLAAYLLYQRIYSNPNISRITDPYWTIYIGIKHSMEFVALILELLVSTAIRSYENPKVNIRQVPKVFRPGFSYHSIEPEENDESRSSHSESSSEEVEMSSSNQGPATRNNFPVSIFAGNGNADERRPIFGNGK